MRVILVLLVIAGIAYYFFRPTFESILGKTTDTYNTQVEDVHDLSN